MSIVHYINGEFVSQETACVNPLDLGFLRGYGVFDYVQTYSQHPFYLIEHLQRLKLSAEKIGLEIPMSLDSLINLTYELIQKNEEVSDAGIRFIVTGGLCGNDLLLPSKHSHLFILFHPYTPHPEEYYTKGMRVITTNMLRIMPSIKTLDYFPAVMAMKRAKELGFDDAIYINDYQELLEGTTSNLFFFKGNTLMTCDTDEIVKGITRNILLEIAKDEFNFEMRPLHLNEVVSCDEAFLCSSVKDVVPLVQIDGLKIGNGIPGPRTLKLRILFRRYLQECLNKSLLSARI